MEGDIFGNADIMSIISSYLSPLSYLMLQQSSRDFLKITRRLSTFQFFHERLHKNLSGKPGIFGVLHIGITGGFLLDTLVGDVIPDNLEFIGVHIVHGVKHPAIVNPFISKHIINHQYYCDNVDYIHVDGNIFWAVQDFHLGFLRNVYFPNEKKLFIFARDDILHKCTTVDIDKDIPHIPNEDFLENQVKRLKEHFNRYKKKGYRIDIEFDVSENDYNNMDKMCEFTGPKFNLESPTKRSKTKEEVTNIKKYYLYRMWRLFWSMW